MTSEPHQVSKPENAWTALFRRIFTGVRPEDWRRICDRCGYTGQAHVMFPDIQCWRFKAKKKSIWVGRGL